MNDTTATVTRTLAVTHVFYKPGALHAVDAVHPVTGKGLYSGKTVEELTAENGPLETITNAEASRRVDAAAVSAPAEITAERWDDALNCLPPQRWVRRNGAESFQFMERYCGNVTSVYVKLGDRFWTWHDIVGTEHEVLVQKATDALAAAEAAHG